MTAVVSTTDARFPGRGGKTPAHETAMVIEGRTRFPTRRRDPLSRRLLKSGKNNGKIGAIVRKGHLKGCPIFTLTLEERATCPTSCALYRTCYGNNMHLAERFEAGARLEAALFLEVDALATEYPKGFLIRLHVLGDFYSPHYVRVWGGLLRDYPMLHVFGFTARVDPECPITQEIAVLTREFGLRWAIRYSGSDMPTLASEVVEMPEHASEGYIVCPNQTGQTPMCSTCGLCWHSKKSITFLRH